MPFDKMKLDFLKSYCEDEIIGCKDGVIGTFKGIPISYIADCRITDVNIVVPDKVVEVTFMDGKKEKAVCQYPDVFNLEYAIGLCIAKHYCGGSSAYHNAVKKGVKVYINKIKREKEQKEIEDRIARKRAKRIAYKERKAAKKREEAINIQKEAYIRAMRELRKDDDSNE